MITLDVFLFGLWIVSIVTSCVVSGIKKILEERNIVYHSSALACLVAVVLSFIIGILYILFMSIPINIHVIIYIIVLMGASWLVSMLGYDKVKAMFLEFKTYKK